MHAVLIRTYIPLLVREFNMSIYYYSTMGMNNQKYGRHTSTYAHTLFCFFFNSESAWHVSISYRGYVLPKLWKYM